MGYKKNQAANTAKLNKAFDNMFSGAKVSDVETKASINRSRSEFKSFFTGNKKAGSPPAVKEVKKDLDPLDRKIAALKNMLNDPASEAAEKVTAKKLIAKLEAKKAGR